MSAEAVNTEAAAVIEQLGLQPHPEGGWFRETWRDHPADGGRGAGTGIYFLLAEGEASHWHRVDAAELWHHYAGAPLELAIVDGADHRLIRLGTDLAAGEEPQATVPAGAWQGARTTGAWTLVGATVSPAFEFESFELAPPSWAPEGWDRPGW